MKETKLIMGMPVTIEIVDDVHPDVLNLSFEYFKYVDEKFSTYKKNSEISLINQGKINKKDYSADMQEIFSLAEKTTVDTYGFFDIKRFDNSYDPSGIVKGWSVHNVANLLKKHNCKNFYVEAGGDIETFGVNNEGKLWKIGIRNPFKKEDIVKVLEIKDKGVATSGTYIRGAHIYNPKDKNDKLEELASITVIGPNVYEADRYATAAFAMGRDGIIFIENLLGFEGYMIDKDGIGTMTSGFEHI